MLVELREHELRTLSVLARLDGKASVDELVRKGDLPDAAVMRAVMVLQEKKLVNVRESKRTVVKLSAEGKTYAEHGLPERRLMVALKELGGSALLDILIEKARLDKQLVPIALGWVRRKKWADFESKTGRLRMTGALEEGFDEKLIALLKKTASVGLEGLSVELRDASKLLRGRKLVLADEKTDRTVELTEAGQTAVKKGVGAASEVTQLTPELIVSGKWRKASFQRYNIEAAVAPTWPGKKHPYLQFLDEVKEKLVNLGFKEMVGTAVETAFFNFDALYTPQDHPARESFDIYFVKSPMYGSVSVSDDVIRNVRKTHEDGWRTGSTGWRYKYSVREARRLLLRGHGTCLSARTLLKGLEVPGKYFSFARCYRPEVMDRTHLTEFNQVEGIVAEENLTLRDLLGILETFAVEIAGAERVRLKPDYYPFTEPSVELSAYSKKNGWIEFGGSGIFRPEVTMPLGVKVPVIAWGLGIDRLFMIKAGVKDIRDVFSKNLDWLRRQKVA
jgi:phenylalanyl-tRNA synthetase alpha chain